MTGNSSQLKRLNSHATDVTALERLHSKGQMWVDRVNTLKASTHESLRPKEMQGGATKNIESGTSAPENVYFKLKNVSGSRIQSSLQRHEYRDGDSRQK